MYFAFASIVADKLALFSFINYVFGSFGNRMVVRSIDSPDGRYRAEINLCIVRMARESWRIYAVGGGMEVRVAVIIYARNGDVIYLVFCYN